MATSAVKRPEEVLPSAELLAHYKARINDLEGEREGMLSSIDRCAVQQDELHRLEWENRKRAEEVRELQQALSDAQAFLFEERQRLLGLQAENDELKLQELEDRKRIQHLLALTRPLEQEVGYPSQGLPSAMTIYPAGAGGAGGSSASPRPGTQQQGPAPAGVAGERVLRTVFLPTANADALLLKVESLQAQLAEQNQLNDERIAALLADRKVREQEESRHRAAYNAQIEALSAKIRRLEDALRITTRDYILARREKQEAEATALAAAAQMTDAIKSASADAGAVKKAAARELERAKEAADGRMREYVDKFREQVRSKEEELTNLRSQLSVSREAAERRIGELEGRCIRLAEANRQLEIRRQLDADGWQSDITLLRKSLAAVDRKLLQMRLIDRLDDDERLDTLLDHLEQRIPGAASLAQQPNRPAGAGGQLARDARPADDDTASEQSVKSIMQGELRAVKDRLVQLEQKATVKRKALKAGAAALGRG